MYARLCHYCALIRLHRPAGTFLLLWPTLWSLWIASDGHPKQIVFLVFILGTFLLRSAGCALNDFADRKFDSQVERTRDRPLAAGAIHPGEALGVAAILLALAFVLVLNLDAVVVGMSFLALLLAGLYPYMKRWIAMPQAFLGLAFGFGIPMAWVAQTGAVPPFSIWLLYLASICWTIAYDTTYALADLEDDRKAGLRSSALLFGNHVRLAIGLFQLAMLGLLLVVGRLQSLGLFFYLGIAIALLLFAYQLYLISRRHRDAYLDAFNSNAWLGGIIFVGIFLTQLPK